MNRPRGNAEAAKTVSLSGRRLALAVAACLAALPVAALIFWGLLTLSFSLPNDAIRDNILDRPAVLLSDRADNGRVIDHHTECIGLSVGLYEAEGGGAPLHERALLAESVYGCDPFMAFLGGEPVTQHRDYYRYWHGHALLSRPLLSIMPYNDMRGLLFAGSMGLFAFTAWRLGRTFSPGLALAFALPFFILNAHGYWVVATKFVTWALVMGGALVMSRRQDEAPFFAFFGLGVLTAGFDFLTAPALIFALPACVHALYAPGAPLRSAITRLVAIGAFWLLGYAGFWLMKFLLAATFFGDAAWADIFGAVGDRLRGASEHVSGYWPGAALIANVAALKTVWGIVAALYFLSLGLRGRARAAIAVFIAALRDSNGRAWSLALLALAPLGFMEVLSNHSQIHAAFTQLNFAPLVFLAGIFHFGDARALFAADPSRPQGA